MKTRIAPAASEGKVSGKNTRQKIVRREAPSEAAACSRRSSSFSIAANSGRTRNGSSTLAVPSTTPNSL